MATVSDGDIVADKADVADKKRFIVREEQDVSRVIEQYGDTVHRLCMIHLKNYHDTEGIFQTVFLKYLLSSVVFENEEHEKAWFIRVTINACKDLLKNFFHSRTVTLDELLGQSDELTPDNSDVLEAVLSLPEKYRDVVYLYFYEEIPPLKSAVF